MGAAAQSADDARAWGPLDSVDQILADWAVQRPDLDFSPVGVVTRLERVRMHLDAGLLQVFSQYELTPADFRVIVALRRSGQPYRLPQARLMTQLALTSGTVSVRIDRLVRRGVVVREADPADKRGQLIRLTAEGLRLFDQIAPAHLANEDRLLSALTDGERTTLRDLLRKLLVSFESGAVGVGVGLALGMRLEPAHVALARRNAVGLPGTDGLLVSETLPGTPAAKANLSRGDLITAVDDRELRSYVTLAEAIARAGPGGHLRLSVLRGSEPLHVTLRIPG